MKRSSPLLRWGHVVSLFAAMFIVANTSTGLSAQQRREIFGAWRGPVEQPGSKPYSLLMVLASETQGASDYPELQCGGILSGSGRGESATYTFHETITYGRAVPGKPGGCIDGTVVVTLRDDDTVSWVWSGSWQGRSYTANATLTRERGSSSR